MKISASIYSNKEKNLEQLVRELDAHGIDMFHIDCFDESVFNDIAAIRQISKTPIDLHIIHKQPAKFLAQIEQQHVEFVSIQYGADVELPDLTEGKIQWGLAVTADDGPEVLEKYGKKFDFVLFMASKPGVSGKPFNKSNFQRIIEFRQQFPKKKVQVDGGVNDSIAFILRLLGVNSIVSGNYLLNQEYLGVGMLNLHKAPNADGGFKVADFMTPAKFLPILSKDKLNLKDTLKTIDKFGLGFALITDSDNKLYGVISNADIRRGFIRHTDDFNAADVKEMINEEPVVIKEHHSLTDMILALNNLNFIVLFLPVVDENGQLKGAVLLNNLTRV